MKKMKRSIVTCIIMALAFLSVSCGKGTEPVQEETDVRIRTDYVEEEPLEETYAEPAGQTGEESGEDKPEDRQEEEESQEEEEPEPVKLTTRELAMLDEPLYEVYKLLDTKEFFNAFYDELLEGIMDQVQGLEIVEFELEEGFDCGAIPEELVRSLGEMFYEGETEVWKGDRGLHLYFGSFFDLIWEYGSREFQISEDEMYDLVPNYTELVRNWYACERIYHFNLSEDQENFLFCFEYDESYCVRHLVLTEYKDGGLVKLMEVQTLQPDYEGVIAYQGGYYYVAIETNYNNQQVRDTIRIQKLGAGMEEEKLLIRYVPDEFIWEDLYVNEENYPEGMEEYIDTVKEELFAGNYLEDGSGYEEIAYLDGDEIRSDSLYPELEERYDYQYYSVDFANIGVPVLIGKYITMPGKPWEEVDMTAQFYVNSLYSGRMWRMQQNSYFEGLRQIWFKEMDGRIYTFQVACPNKEYYWDTVRESQLYIYQLNVLLVEGDQVTVINKALATAKMHFIVTREESTEWLESYRPEEGDDYYD